MSQIASNFSSRIVRLVNDTSSRHATDDPNRDGYSVISEIENDRHLLEEILKPKSLYGPVELSSSQARRTQRLLREMCSMLQDLQEMADSSN